MKIALKCKGNIDYDQYSFLKYLSLLKEGDADNFLGQRIGRKFMSYTK